MCQIKSFVSRRRIVICCTINMSSDGNSAKVVTRRSRKRQFPPVLNGIPGTSENKDSNFVCPICFDLIEEAYMTKCGHSFCYECIQNSLTHSNRCPKCNHSIERQDQIFPNFSLNDYILKYKQEKAETKKKVEKMKIHGSSELQELLKKEFVNLDIQNVNFMMDLLLQKKGELEINHKALQRQILKEFLQQIKRHKQDQLDHLNYEMSLVKEDAEHVDSLLANESPEFATFLQQAIQSANENENANANANANANENENANDNPTSVEAPPTSSSNSGFNSNTNEKRLSKNQLATQRLRMNEHFDELEQCYFSIRSKFSLPSLSLKEPSTVNDSNSCLEEFTESLNHFTRFTHIRPLATLSYASDIFSGSSIVSSIEFDKDNEYFAIAGVTKKIKVFEYPSVIKDSIDNHFPVSEMLCNSKISCISWSSYHKSMLASSDYEGTVTVWDMFSGQKVKTFQEHEKRCWSVDFNRVDIKLIASGSDDGKVKLWSTQAEHSIGCLEVKANVCCVKFNPESRHHLAFGSADHSVHYYDLRNSKKALGIYKGHKKAVSYVKFLNDNEIVSASTDSQLKLWNTSDPICLRSFKGHINEKNFVGLATDGNYVTCGSENNSLYIYYKGLSKQLFTFRFDTVRSILEKDRKEDDTNEFVSAVCWRTGSNVVVAANSQGTIKLIGAVFCIGILSVLLELLKSSRAYLIESLKKQSKDKIKSKTLSPKCSSRKYQTMPEQNVFPSKKCLIALHSLQTLLTIAQLFFGYILMLAVMYYNIWIFIALLLGSGIGYFISGIFLQRPFMSKEVELDDKSEVCNLECTPSSSIADTCSVTETVNNESKY
ncbi:E3 ubiquitin-protein ligase COP1 [Nymphon striatum]|nr:E3 ubiquitin-protein ligase COP1 [Nymphon striatum]